MKKFKVLVVEDVDIAQKMTKMALENCGCEVDVFDNGGDAIELYQQVSFDLVLVDVGLPDTDGFTIAETLRELDKDKTKTKIKSRRTMIVAVTVHADQRYRELAKDSGFDDYIIKPFTGESAKKLINKLRINKSGDDNVIELFTG
jgi:two-component system, OmpR family, aerobic respiration control sensor histidine kinase ArcB